MPRGRHRHSQPLHRLLPPATVAGSAALLAVGALAIGDPVLLRVFVVAAAGVAGGGAFLLRSWDRAAGKQVADLKTARVRDEWRADERIAELEVDLEDSRELRGKLENKLRGKRAELARLRTEHADLLRRYATAESERARALEDGRVAKKAVGAGSSLPVPYSSPVSPAAYLRAAAALRDLPRNGARQQAALTVEEARRRDVADIDEPQGRHAADTAVRERPAEATSSGTGGAPALPVRKPKLVPAVAAAVLPYAKPNRQASRAQGGFDFFGTKSEKAPAKESPAAEPEEADLADVVGDEAVAEQAEVIDLTVHDETEQLDLSELRAQSS
ncbi:hypothetical protein [Streptomyces sp. NPDC026673]|uniref:hypothetical protein n=1 Tax=Streptomyces sp. NPDC026673 TaxID=3155724 RepID=UPI00340C21F5